MIRIALPKGSLQPAVRSILERGGITLGAYSADSRSYDAAGGGTAAFAGKMFREKDIPVQVAFGNYDIGLCTSVWADEYLAAYPAANLVKAIETDLAATRVVVCASGLAGSVPPGTTEDLVQSLPVGIPVRIVSEFPNIAQQYAVKSRIPHFRIFGVWGAASAYPPESAELVVLNVQDEMELLAENLVRLETLSRSSLCVVVNRTSLGTRNVSPILSAVSDWRRSVA